MKEGYSKRFLCLSLFLSAFIIVALLCAGCTGNSNGGRDEKVLRVVSYIGPDTSGSLDPALKWEGWYVRQAGLYESLFYFDTDMNLQPELATGYRQLSDTEWEVTLRDDVYFHDGTKMDADAVVYSINRVLDPSNSRSEEYSFVDNIRKTDDYTIVITTKEPYAPAVYPFADPVMSIVSPSAENLEKEPVGTGPYKFVSFEPGSSMDLVANENYRGGRPNLDKVKMIYNTDPATRSLMILSGDVDISWNFLASDYVALNADPDIQNISPKVGTRTEFLFVNGNKKPFDDFRVRQAISYALDRREIADTALEGIGGVPATGIFSSVIPWSAYDELPSYDNDTEKALKLFAEAGITQGGDGKLYYNGEPFSIEIATSTKGPTFVPVSEVAAAQLEKIGITTSVNVMDYSALASECRNGNYDLSTVAWVTAPEGDPDYFLSLQYLSTGSYAAWTGYSNPEVDDMIVEARTIFDKDERYAVYNEIQRIVQDDMPLIPLAYITNNFALKNNVKGFEIYPNELTVITSEIDLT
ncbi:peptide/nickel transport system substrate-binding protein [Methanomicrobium sp. W14]|uniref:ABC transporter substrate-binding protein n=1 Tax=Methanomicrobium sp. W14 TaxID=2817839 RepID=UPI001AE95F6C|nr:ABC transporter substrate-binding protein [Methanomicrobium sp. W14]MBP2132202.1 peptide/nickel transport system substrate-binding protein [Methanomicrobium sp. W14]